MGIPGMESLPVPEMTPLPETQSIFSKTQSDPSTAAVRKIDATVARVSPALYAAGARTALTREEKNLIENWAKVKDTHKKLMTMKNKDAGDAFNKLEPGFQEVLKTYYNTDYANKTDGSELIQNTEIRKALGIDDGTVSFGDVIKSPFRFLMGAATQYGKFFNTPGNMLQNSIVNKESFWTRSNGEVSFEGKYLYDNELADELVNKYGGAESFVAMHVLAGDTPGEIIDAWGPNDASILTAINFMFNEPEEFEVMLGEFSRAQLSPGRNIGRALNKTFGIDTNANAGLFSLGTGAIDMAYQIFADPLTYLTLGASAVAKGASNAAKLADNIKSGSDVASYLANPKVAEYFSGYTKLIGELGAARGLKDVDPVQKAEKVADVTRRLQKDYADHASPEELETWLEYGVVDLPSFARLFEDEGAKEFTRLIRGRSLETSYAREGASEARASRNVAIGMKEHLRDFFTGKVDYSQAPVDYADLRPAMLSDNLDDVVIEQRKHQNRLQKFIEQQTRLHPGRAVVFHDDANVSRSIDIFHRQAFLATGRRDLADLITADFLTATQAERFALHRSVFELNMRRAGIHGMPGGKQFIEKALDAHFGTRQSWTTSEELMLPVKAGSGRAMVPVSVSGPLHSSQFQSYVSAPDWRAISEFVASNALVKDKDASAVSYIPQLIGGAYNHRVTGIATDLWTTLTLIPQLGIRTAVDEGFMFLMYANGALISNYRTSKKYQRILNAATGPDDLSAIGPVKNAVQAGISRVLGKPIGAARSISDDVREEVRARVQKSDKTAYEQELEIRETILDMAIDMHGKGLDDVQRAWFKQLAMDNPNVLRDVSSKNVTDALQGKAARMNQPELLTASQLDIALQELGLVAQGAVQSRAVAAMRDADVDITMFRNFTRIFNDSGFERRDGSQVSRFSFGSVFLKHNGIQKEADELTGEIGDWQRAVDEMMVNFGFIKTSDGLWKPRVGKEKEIKKFISSTRFFEGSADLTDDSARMLQFVEAGLADVYKTFHGAEDLFNENLLARFADYTNGKVSDHRKLMRDLTFGEYSELITGYKAKGRLLTDIQFDGVSTDLTTWIRQHGPDQAFDLMARQTDSIMRMPVVHMHYIAYRAQYEAGEKAMVEQLVKSRTQSLLESGNKIDDVAIRKEAEEQAGKFFANKAINDASQHVLKYSDNPAMQSVFAYNMRTVGRFYRAIEDFHRRMYRLVKDNPLNVIYRLRLMNQGFDAVGDIHTDQDGQKYAILPMDDVIYNAVDTTIRTLTGGEESIKQPLFSDITFNLTAGNPSFQTDAGMPYLSGPMGSISVVAAKAMLGIFNPTKNLAEDTDNLLLGDMGDNVTLASAVTPKLVRNTWAMLNPDEKSTQEISALTQALSYNQANGISIDPNDKKYINEDGSINTALFEKDKVEYLKNTRISAHNIIVTRMLLGLVLPFSVQTKNTKDLPEYLLDSGIVSMQESFYEVLDQIKSKYPDASDHYEMALATWMGENPGKIAYLVSKKSKEIQPILNYSREMQNWTISNQAAVDAYGAGALLFAPSSGEFDPGVWQWATAAGIAKNTDIDEYYGKVSMQQYINQYYELSDKEAEELRVIPFSYVAARREIVEKYKQQRKIMNISVPGLENYIKSGVDNTEAFEFVNNAFNYATSDGAAIDPMVKESIITAYNLYNDFISKADRINASGAANGAELKRAEKEKITEALKELYLQDPTGAVEQYYNYGLKKLINAKSKDASAGINRNE